MITEVIILQYSFHINTTLKYSANIFKISALFTLFSPGCVARECFHTTLTHTHSLVEPALAAREHPVVLFCFSTCSFTASSQPRSHTGLLCHLPPLLPDIQTSLLCRLRSAPLRHTPALVSFISFPSSLSEIHADLYYSPLAGINNHKYWSAVSPILCSNPNQAIWYAVQLAFPDAKPWHASLCPPLANICSHMLICYASRPPQIKHLPTLDCHSARYSTPWISTHIYLSTIEDLNINTKESIKDIFYFVRCRSIYLRQVNGVRIFTRCWRLTTTALRVHCCTVCRDSREKLMINKRNLIKANICLRKEINVTLEPAKQLYQSLFLTSSLTCVCFLSVPEWFRWKLLYLRKWWLL